MTESGRSHKLGASLLITSALMLASANVGAQTPPTTEQQSPPAGQPPEQGQPGQQPPGTTTPPPTSEPAPPPPPKPEVTYPLVTPMREIKLTEHFSIRFGLQAQVWYEAAQSSFREQPSGDKGAYGFNFYCRRCRILGTVQPWDNVTLAVLVETATAGKAVDPAPGTPNPAASTKSFGVVQMLDAFGEIRLMPEVIINAGLMLIPITRNGLQGTTTYIPLDVGFTSAAHISALNTTVLRDIGLLIKGYLVGEHLEYRLGAFTGIREPAVTMVDATHPSTMAGSRNVPLFAAWLQYNFLDVDKGYVFNGIYYGKKRIAGVSAGLMQQKGRDKDSALAFSASAFAAYPLNGPNKDGGDEVHGLVQYTHWDGKETAPTILNQNDLLVELGYYNRSTKLSVFGKFEGQFNVQDDTTMADETLGNIIQFGGGVKYNLIDNLTNFTFQYLRTNLPNDPPGRNNTNTVTLAIQFFYY